MKLGKYGRLLATEGATFSRSSTGISPRPMLMGAAHNALRAFNARVSLTPSVFRRPQAATLVLRSDENRSPVTKARSANLKRGHGAPAYGSAQTGTYPSALYCAGGLPSGFLFQGTAGAMRKGVGDA